VKVALLAAGLGSRLGPLTAETPKALIPVGGKTLLAHALGFAARLAPAQVLVVGGFGYDGVAAEVAELRRPGGAIGPLPPITLLENREFRRGNLLSLQAARPHLDDDFLLLNVDHIFRPSIAPLVAAPVAQVTAFVDTDRNLGADDMKVKRDDQGHVARISKTLDSFDCGYVGMTRVPAPSLSRYFAEVDAALTTDGQDIHVERILARLADAGVAPHCRDISGHGWLEIDTPAERDQAEAALRSPGWA
jgi:L-glutamine-phosphate cytidylyltransferase